MKGYDSHLFVSGLFKYGFQKNIKKTKQEFITYIPNNEEIYIGFSKMIKVDTVEFIDKITGKLINEDVMFEIRFLDTIGLMASSLDSLTSNLKKGCNNINELISTFKNTSEHFTNDNEFLLMTEKGIYCYVL